MIMNNIYIGIGIYLLGVIITYGRIGGFINDLSPRQFDETKYCFKWFLILSWLGFSIHNICLHCISYKSDKYLNFKHKYKLWLKYT